MSKTKILIHLVFATKKRQPILIDKENRQELYKYLRGILKNNNCYTYWINGIEDHLHLLFDLHPSVSLSNLVKTLKTSTNKHIKENNLFQNFDSWSSGYYAGSLSPNHQNACIDYIKEQEVHHSKCDFDSEMRRFASKYGLEYYEEDWQ